MDSVRTISPIDGAVVVTRPFVTKTEALGAANKAREAQTLWQALPLERRIVLLSKAVDWLLARKDTLAEEITVQMGRPLSQTPGELDGMAYRARHMLEIAEEALADRQEIAPDGKEFFIRRAPLGIVFSITPWNYPYMTAINSIIPALAAGNAVLLKPSPQTPTVGEAFAEAFRNAGLPDGVFQCLHMSVDTALEFISEGDVQHVSFTGSVAGGKAVEEAASGRFLSVGLELGGKDAAYVRADADLVSAVETLVDGAMFNSGQSCCGIERIYVAESLYDQFISAYADAVKAYRLGDPRETATNIGPVVSVAAAARIRNDIAEAVEAGATALVDESQFTKANPETAYVAPQVLVDVDHTMVFMREETFGPCVGIMSVASDDEAIDLVNDSRYGLTASVWSRDTETALRVMDRLNTGTVFLNRCDALEPALAWTGVKQSGRGCTLSRFGYDALTRPKSFNIVHP